MIRIRIHTDQPKKVGDRMFAEFPWETLPPASTQFSKSPSTFRIIHRQQDQSRDVYAIQYGKLALEEQERNALGERVVRE